MSAKIQIRTIEEQDKSWQKMEKSRERAIAKRENLRKQKELVARRQKARHHERMS